LAKLLPLMLLVLERGFDSRVRGGRLSDAEGGGGGGGSLD
jgi:hypothetical protein